MAILVLFASIEGQSRKIGKFVETKLCDSGYDVTSVNVSAKMANVTFEGYDTVVLVAPVHERRHPQNFELLLTTSQKELAARRTLMISVSLGAAFPELKEEAREYLIEMKMRTGLNPDAEHLSAGAVRPSSYGYYEAEILRHVVLRNQSIDHSAQEHEFTDWDALEATIEDFVVCC